MEDNDSKANMFDLFTVSAGCVRGVDHALSGRNCQDAFFWQWDGITDSTVGVVCDGCGSQLGSEVGAKLGARLISASIERHLVYTSPSDESFWDSVRREVCAQIHSLASQMGRGEEVAGIIASYFLFTVVGFVIRKDKTHIFWLGDGVRCVSMTDGNSYYTAMEAAEGNKPPYLAYNIVKSSFAFPPEALQLSRAEYNTEDITAVLVASDGATQMRKVHDRVTPLPGFGGKVGLVTQFLDGKVYGGNSQSVQRKLNCINPPREAVIINSEGQPERCIGLLADDTTVLCATRKEKP